MDAAPVISQTVLWVGFLCLTALLIGADMLTSRRLQRASLRLAALHVGGWVAVATAACAAVWFLLGTAAAGEFATAYLLELSLSVDNVFVFAVAFTAFAVDERCQRRALLWGVLGAFVMRGACILGGVAILQRYEWMMYVFGAVLAATSVRMLASPDKEPEIATHWTVRFCRRLLPMSDRYDGDRFFTKTALGWRATPLLLVVCVIELTDLLFAVDSIPAVLGITRDPFIAFSSNVMAVLGLRALYFLVAGFLRSVESLKYGLALVLLLIGAKFIAEPLGLHVPATWTLSGIAAILVGNVLIAVAVRRRGAGVDSRLH